MRFNVGLVFGGTGAETGINIQAAKDVSRVLEHYGVQTILVDINKQDVNEQVADCDLCVGIEKTAKSLELIDAFNTALKKHGVEYIGQSDATRMLLRDKFEFSERLCVAGVSVPRGLRFLPNKLPNSINTAIKELSRPLIIKPNNGSLSEGVVYAEDDNCIRKAFEQASKKGNDFLVQEYVSGQEITCPLVHLFGVDVQGIPVEIGYTGKIYDFKTKNVTLRNKLYIPPLNWSTLQQKDMNEVVRIAGRVSNNKFAIRIDTRLNGAQFSVLEANAEPNLSKNDFVSRSFNAAGFSYADLVIGLMANSATFLSASQSQKRLANKVFAVKKKIDQYLCGR